MGTAAREEVGKRAEKEGELSHPRGTVNVDLCGHSPSRPWRLPAPRS